MINNLTDLITEAQINLVRNPQDFAHEVTHHYRTWLIAKEISSELSLEFDEEILKLICWWHDVKIQDLDYSTNRVCKVVAEYLGAKIEEIYRSHIIDGIKNHEFGSSPEFIEGKILQDADKLEIISEERLEVVIQAIEDGKMDVDPFYKSFMIVKNEWLPKMPEMYNFDISRKLHEERLAKLDFQKYISKLENLTTI